MEGKVKVIIFCLLIATFAENFAQSRTVAAQSNISGVVWEMPEGDTTGMSIPGANVLLLNARDSSLINGTSSGLDGSFMFSQVNQDNYLLAVSFL